MLILSMQPRRAIQYRLLAGTMLALLVNYTSSQAASSSVTLPTDADGSQIQAALDGLPADGEVVLSAGTYEISQPLLLRHGHQTLRGAGPATILHLADHANCPVVVLGPPVEDGQAVLSNLGLADLLIDGNRRHQEHEDWKSAANGSLINNNGVHVWNATDVTIDHVVCRRCRSGGMVMADIRRLRVSDFESYDNQFDGLACYQTQASRFQILRLHDNLAAGISLDLGFNGNCVTNAVLTGNDLGIFMRASRDNVFQGLTISGSRHDGVFMAQSVIPTAKGWQWVPDTECTGNRFDGLIVRDSGGMAFRVNDASCTNNTISGAIFQNNRKGGLGQPVSHPVSLSEVAHR